MMMPKKNPNSETRSPKEIRIRMFLRASVFGFGQALMYAMQNLLESSGFL
jgi:hypothetical protein